MQRAGQFGTRIGLFPWTLGGGDEVLAAPCNVPRAVRTVPSCRVLSSVRSAALQGLLTGRTA